ncbi:MAG: zinc-dependent metalloprotease [Xanthomonadales bacterium]|nr:zinc-dependent metalloprotease [Xanthomonadales bacterium]
MKRISFFAIVFLFSNSLIAQESFDLQRKTEQPDLFQQADQLERRVIEPGSVLLNGNEISGLMRARRGTVLRLPSIDSFIGNEEEPLEFERINIYAVNARIMVISDLGSVRIEPELRHFFLATNTTTTVGLAVNPDTGAVSGHAIKGGGEVEIVGNLDGLVNFDQVDSPDDGSVSCGTELDEQPPDAVAFLKDEILPSQSVVSAVSEVTWQADIAVDTDTEWMAGKNNDPSTATTWIENLFLSMNVMFERDVNTRLLIGDMILRIGPDPYDLDGNDRSAALTEFGEYWRVNQDDIERDFAAMLSGRISAGRFSGIAWVNQYCKNGRRQSNGQTAGSYSYNAVGTNWSASAASKYIGHELGHNMGSPHTHCLSNGSGGFVDQCSTAGGSDCFSGATSCPAAGRGTTMSYCHVLGGCGSTSDFHPIVQNLLEDRLAANSPNCIEPFENTSAIPSMTIRKEISVNGGNSWFDADTAGTAPTVEFPSGAEYRLSVNNDGEVDLVNVTVSDAALGINYLVGNLSIGSTAVLDSDDIAQLAQAQVCNSTATYTNTASALGESASDGTVFGPVTDDASLNCVALPTLTISKQISINGGSTWFDADTAGSAPTVEAPSGAQYRVTLNNNGSVNLINVRLNDIALGISNYSVGNLAAGGSVILDSGDIALLNQAQVCSSATTFTNIASATGESSISGTGIGPVTDNATLNCIEVPKPLFRDGFE